MTDTPKTLKEMTESEAVEIFKAWRRGDSIEMHSAKGWEQVWPMSLYRNAHYYRLPPKRKPSLKRWDVLPAQYKWVVRDEDGMVWAVDKRPEPFKNTWLACEASFINLDNFILGYDPGDLDWRDSLTERPEGV